MLLLSACSAAQCSAAQCSLTPTRQVPVLTGKAALVNLEGNVTLRAPGGAPLRWQRYQGPTLSDLESDSSACCLPTSFCVLSVSAERRIQIGTHSAQQGRGFEPKTLSVITSFNHDGSCDRDDVWSPASRRQTFQPRTKEKHSIFCFLIRKINPLKCHQSKEKKKKEEVCFQCQAARYSATTTSVSPLSTYHTSREKHGAD